MDVRCEKCQTEYELDESKLKPGGVTVKCTTCGHMFKVRRRGATHPSNPVPVATQDAPSSRMLAADTEDGDRTWLVRLEDGEIKTCRELSTLQKWIVSGRVSRGCAISRTGKKWKLLGEIGELTSFFSIADEAVEARASGKWAGTITQEYPLGAPPDSRGAPGHPRVVPRRASSSAGEPIAKPMAPARPAAPPEPSPNDTLRDAPPPTARIPGGPAPQPQAQFASTLPLGSSLLKGPQRAATPVPPPAQPSAATKPTAAAKVAARPAGKGYGDEAPTIQSPEESAALARAAEQAAESFAMGSPSSPRASYASQPPGPVSGEVTVQPSSAPATAGWAAQSQGQVVRVTEGSGVSGPTSGMTGMMARGRASEAAFVANKIPDIRGEYENGRFVPTDSFEEPLVPAGSRAGLWIVLVSLVVLAAAGVAVYFILFRDSDKKLVAADAAPVAVTPPPASAVATPLPPTVPATPAAGLDALVAEADAALASDVQATLTAAGEKLAALDQPGAPASALALAARARIESALAQHSIDRGRLAATPAEGKKLAAEARTRGAAARALADRALSLDGDHTAALVAMADARRIEGERSVEVERVLRQAQQGAAASQLAREIDLVKALLLVRDERLRDARVALDKLAKGAPAGDVRARYRLAWLSHLDKNAEGARADAQAVLAAQAQHEGAQALLEKLGADASGGQVAGGGGTPAGGGGTPAGGGGTPAGGGGEESVDAMLGKADKAAENGNCKTAMTLYRKVLDEVPSNVEALTGLGYCHLDRREFASAQNRFRAALGLSSRYRDAMWGIAEAFEQQGLKKQAMERYQAFVDAHGDNAKAGAARAKIEKLRAAIEKEGGGEAPPSEGGGTTPTPPTPPTEGEPGGT